MWRDSGSCILIDRPYIETGIKNIPKFIYMKRWVKRYLKNIEKY